MGQRFREVSQGLRATARRLLTAFLAAASAISPNMRSLPCQREKSILADRQ